MIPAGLVNALVAYAEGSPTKTAALVTEQQACVEAILNGGKDRRAITEGTINGKSFSALTTLSIEDKLTVLTTVLEQLGVLTAKPTVTYTAFDGVIR